MENIREILETPISNLSMGYHTLIGRILQYSDNFIVRGEFNVELYESLQGMYYNYPNQTEPNHRDDEPKPSKALKSSRTDTCVICLTEPPNVLFTDCRLICLCLECEEIKPLGKCSYCKTTISTKIIV